MSVYNMTPVHLLCQNLRGCIGGVMKHRLCSCQYIYDVETSRASISLAYIITSHIFCYIALLQMGEFMDIIILEAIM